MRTKPHRTYVLVLGAVLSIGLGLIAGTAWGVDPFAIHSAYAPGDRLYGIGPYTRIAKPYLAAALAPRIIIAGSSRAEYVADPKIAEKWLGLSPAFNIALSGANAYEMRRNVEHVIAIAPVEVQIVALDFYMFNTHMPTKANFSEARLAVAPDGTPNPFYHLADLGPTLLSRDAIDVVRREFKYRRKIGKCTEYWWPNGLRVSKTYECGASKPERHSEKFRTTLKAYLTQNRLYRGFKLAEGPDPEKARNGLGNIERLLRLGLEKRQRVFLYISPVHALQLEAIQRTGRWALFERWKSELTFMTARFAAQGLDVVLWDFADFNQITTEPAPTGATLNKGGDGKEKPSPIDASSARTISFYDSHHVRPAVGELMFERMLSKGPQKAVPEDFGVRLTPDTLMAHLADTRAQRDVWRKSHPRDVAFFEAIVQSAAKAAKKPASRQ